MRIDFIKKTVLLISIAFFILTIGFIVHVKPAAEELYANVPENHLLIRGMYLTHIMNNEGSHLKIKSREAYYNNDNMTLFLSGNDVTMIDGVNEFTNFSDSGEYKIDEYLSTQGNIHGLYNTMTYKTEDNGNFIYDFTKEEASLYGDSLFNDEQMMILSPKVKYDAMKKSVLFYDATVKIEDAV